MPKNHQDVHNTTTHCAGDMYLLTLRSIRLLTLIAACTVGSAAVGCSSADESPPLETAASAAAPQRPASTAPDTSRLQQTPETSTALKATVRPSEEPTTKVGTRAGEATPDEPVARPAPAVPATTASDSPPAVAPGGPDKWLSYDASTNTVTFELIAGPFTFNGYRNGEGTLVVPPKANIVMNFVNKDGTPHSAIIISGEGPIPNSASDPAIPRAYTSKVLEGLPQEAGDVMRFPVPESGTYRIFCGVPGHGLSGMWIWMRIDPAAKVPSFGPTKA